MTTTVCYQIACAPPNTNCSDLLVVATIRGRELRDDKTAKHSQRDRAEHLHIRCDTSELEWRMADHGHIHARLPWRAHVHIRVGQFVRLELDHHLAISQSSYYMFCVQMLYAWCACTSVALIT